MRSSTPLLLASAALSTALNVPRQQQDWGLGNWTFTQWSSDSAPSVGASWRDVTVQYSGSDTAIQCHWSTYHGQETSSCTDPSFSYTIGVRPSQTYFEVLPKQKVVIDGQKVTVFASGAISLKCGQGVGYACVLDPVPQVVVATTTI